jgi:hypothetical protein
MSRKKLSSPRNKEKEEKMDSREMRKISKSVAKVRLGSTVSMLLSHPLAHRS